MPKIVQYNLPPGGTVIELADNTSEALDIESTGADYITINTTDSGETMTLKAGSGPGLLFEASRIRSGAGGQFGLQLEDPSSTNPVLVPNYQDADTGIGRADADQLSLIAGGQEGIRITESSDAITAITCNGPVQVPDGTTSAPGVAFKDQTNTGIIRPSTNNLGFVCNGTTRMQISGGGDVLIASGGGSAGGRFEVIGAGSGAAIKARSAGTGDVLHTRDSANADCFVVKEDRTVELAGYADGTLSVASGVVTSSSDARLKDFTGTLDTGLDKVLQLEPKFFNWKNDKMSQHQLGFFAQDVHAVCPEAGTKAPKMVPVGLTDPDNENSSPIMGQATDENGDPDFQWGLNHGALIALLVKSVQELTARIEQLESGS